MYQELPTPLPISLVTQEQCLWLRFYYGFVKTPNFQTLPLSVIKFTPVFYRAITES